MKYTGFDQLLEKDNRNGFKNKEKTLLNSSEN